MGGVLQRAEVGLLDEEEAGLRRGAACHAAAKGGLHGRRRLALCLGEGRSRRGVDVHESAVREGGGIQGLRGVVYDQPRRHRRPGVEHLPCEDEVNSNQQLSASCHVV